MLLCPISPHLAHPHSLHCGALSQAASSFWSQQQCYSINPLAGYATLYKWCCFPSDKSPRITSVMLPVMQPGIRAPSPSQVTCPAPCAPLRAAGRTEIFMHTCSAEMCLYADLKLGFPKTGKTFCRNKMPESTSLRRV